MTQAVMRKIATFEIIDGDLIKEHVWQYEQEEDADYYIEASGYDSFLILFTYGLPLYFFAFNIFIHLPLALLNFLRKNCKCQYLPDA